jgi:hypothetical protein
MAPDLPAGVPQQRDRTVQPPGVDQEKPDPLPTLVGPSLLVAIIAAAKVDPSDMFMVQQVRRCRAAPVRSRSSVAGQDVPQAVVQQQPDDDRGNEAYG